MATAVNLLFAILWSVALYLALDFFGRRAFPVARQRTLAAGIAAAAFLVGGLFAPLRHAAPPPDSASPTPAAAAAPTLIPPPRDVSAACPAESTKALPKKAVGSLDSAIDTASRAPLAALTVLHGNQGVTLLGWAADSDETSPASAVCADVDGAIATGSPAIYGGNRSDVATVYRRPGLQLTGFEVVVPARLMRPGVHLVRIVVIDRNGKRMALEPARTFRVR